VNNRIIQLIAFTFFLLLSEILCSQELGCLNYTPTEGLVQSQVQDMFQDSKGFIWLGTKGGVSRFDGTNFKNYTTNEGLIDNSILKIFEVNNNCLFILTRIGFSLLSNNKFINYYLPNNINLLVSANSYGFDDDNNIIFPYFESESLKFAKYVNGKTFPCSKINKLISENKSFQKQNYIGLEIIYSRNYKCFYILLNNEIYSLKSDVLKKIITLNEYKNKMIKGKDNEIYLSSGKTFYKINNDKLVEFKTRDNDYELVNFIVDRKGDIYQILSLQECIYAINNDLFHNSIKSQAQMSIDNEDNLWIFGENGIQKMFPKNFINFPVSTYNSLYDTWNICEVKNNIYFFTYSLGVSMYNNKDIKRISIPDTLNKLQFYMGNTKYKNEKILVNIRSYGISIFDGKTFSKLNSKFFKEYTPFYTYYDEKKDIVLSGTTVGLIIFDNKDYRIIDKPFGNKNPNHKVVCIAKDTLGRYWLGGFKKISLLVNDSIINFPTKEFPFDFGGNTMYVDYKGNIWIGNEKGLFFYNYKTFKKIDIPNFKSIMGFITGVEKNRLLIGNMNNLGVLFLDNFYLTGNCHIKLYDKYNGFLASECGQNGAFTDSKGYVWIAGTDRVVKFDPRIVKINQNPPKTYFKELSYINPKMKKITLYDNVSDNFKLKYNQKNIRIDYGAISTTAPQKVKFKYMLEGYDLTWSEANDQQFVVYTNLPPKKYLFKVKACNEDGIWSQQPTEIAFYIKPAYWQTWWFKSLVAIIIISIIIIAVNHIFKNKRKQIQRKYESEKKIKELQLKALKGQIDPHFTFNAINAISSLIYREERKLAYHYFTKFAQLIRSVLLSSNNITRSLQDEIHFIENYLEIEKFRFKDKFEYYIEVDKDVDKNIQIPQMLIQTYVENSIKHGIMHLNNNGVLIIQVHYDQNNNIMISITDNGIGREKASKISAKGAGLGISIMNQFFELYNSVNSNKIKCEIIDLYDDNGNANGTKVKIFFPKDFKYSI
jgi:two-component sensor histidine kinase